MGRKRKFPKHKQTKPKWFQREDEWGNFKFDWTLGLPGETWRVIFAILIIILASVILLGFFDRAGFAGQMLAAASQRIFGQFGAYLVALIIIYSGFVLLVPPKGGYKLSRFIGLMLLVAAISILLHLFIPADESMQAANESRGGGLFGYLISQPLRNGIGLFPTFLVAVAMAFIAFAMTTSFSLSGKESKRDEGEEESKINVNIGNKVSVFEIVKRRLSAMKKPKEAPASAPVIETMPSIHPNMMAKRDIAWEYPPLDLLKDTDEVASSGNIHRNAEIIEKTLKNFGIDIVMGDVNIGPTVTQYTLKPTEGVKLNQIVARQNDLALALSAKSLRVEAPIPGKNLVGIEVPNKVSAKVTLREVLVSKESRAVRSKLSLALGRDVAGEPVAIDLEKMPHLLIAGATGSGKSVCINSVIVTLLYNNSPADLRLILVDPKRVELTSYNGIPHLLAPVVTEVDKTISSLKWAVHEMERRYELLSRTGRRNITAYNTSPSLEGKLPYLVIVIDELADLMATSAKEVEGSIVRLAQMARATGIHLIVATQRPSVDVLTGLIKANIPCRLAFATASQIDSRTILDVSGAEKLLGNGDMLFLGNGIEKPRRVQGCFVSDQEIESINSFLKEKGEAEYDDSVLSFRPTRSGGVVGLEGASEDELYDEAVETVVRAGKASASLLQRRLRVGYARAARLLDILEESGVIGASEGSKPRDVLISSEEGPRLFQSHGTSIPIEDLSQDVDERRMY